MCAIIIIFLFWIRRSIVGSYWFLCWSIQFFFLRATLLQIVNESLFHDTVISQTCRRCVCMWLGLMYGYCCCFMWFDFGIYYLILLGVNSFFCCCCCSYCSLQWFQFDWLWYDIDCFLNAALNPEQNSSR